MGRILRKKGLQKPKKKKGIDEGAASPANTETSSDQAAAAVVADKEPKRQMPTQKKAVSAVKSSQGGTARNLMEKSLQFLREVKVELKKVTWPSRKQTLGSTLVVIILVIIISLFLGVVDVSLSSLIRLVFK